MRFGVKHACGQAACLTCGAVGHAAVFLLVAGRDGGLGGPGGHLPGEL